MAVKTAAAGLAAMMREGSQHEHNNAEGSPFVTEMMECRLGAPAYAAYLARMLRVYEALEDVGDHLASDPVVGPFVDPALDRAPALRRDLEFWGVGTISNQSPAVDAYVERIHATAAEPALYVAHHYTRYLGDLSGGQIIGKKFAREYDLTDGRGIEFYAFPDIAKPKIYKDNYRASLDALPVDATMASRVVEEVRRAFRHNEAVFVEMWDVVEAA